MIALEYEGRCWSDTDFHAQVQTAVSALRTRSTTPGHIEFIEATCTPETVWKLHACRTIGIPCVMVSPSATAEQRNQLHAIAQTTIPSDTQDAWLWISTSGTTGQPRLIGLSDQQLTASADASQQRLGHQPNDRWLCCLPLHHIGGISIALRTATYQTTMVLHPQFDAATVSRAIDDHHITQVSMVPTMLKRVLDHRKERPFPPHLRFILLGGAPASAALIDRCRALQAPVAITWGMTETASQVATRTPGDLRPDPDVGLPLSGITVVEHQGRLVVRGPIAPGGEYTTSDRGSLDNDGRVIVSGRGSDLIISGGENIDPNTIERAIEKHPNVEECAVIGRASEEWGERPVAFLVGTHTADLDVWLKDKLQNFQQPDEWFWVDTLPRTAMGKLDRPALVEQSQAFHRIGKFNRD